MEELKIRQIPKYKDTIQYVEAENIYIKYMDSYSDISETLIEDFNPKESSLLQEIINMSRVYELKIISRYKTEIDKKTKLKSGKQATSKKITYAFQDIETGEVYANIILDGSPFKNLEKLYLAVTDFNYLNAAKNYSLYIDDKELEIFSGKVKFGEEDGFITINGKEVEKSKLISTEFTRNKNILEVLIPIMYGIFDAKYIEDMTCLIDKIPLTRRKFGITNTTFDLHHILVELGNSLNKFVNELGEKVEPSNHLLDTLLRFNTIKIKDLMGTLIFCQTAHKHQHGYTTIQGIDIYSVDELSYCLKSEKNYNKVLAYFGIIDDEGYYSFISRQINTNMLNNFINPNRLIIKEDAREAA